MEKLLLIIYTSNANEYILRWHLKYIFVGA